MASSTFQQLMSAKHQQAMNEKVRKIINFISDADEDAKDEYIIHTDQVSKFFKFNTKSELVDSLRACNLGEHHKVITENEGKRGRKLIRHWLSLKGLKIWMEKTNDIHDKLRMPVLEKVNSLIRMNQNLRKIQKYLSSVAKAKDVSHPIDMDCVWEPLGCTKKSTAMTHLRNCCLENHYIESVTRGKNNTIAKQCLMTLKGFKKFMLRIHTTVANKIQTWVIEQIERIENGDLTLVSEITGNYQKNRPDMEVKTAIGVGERNTGQALSMLEGATSHLVKTDTSFSDEEFNSYRNKELAKVQDVQTTWQVKIHIAEGEKELANVAQQAKMLSEHNKRQDEITCKKDETTLKLTEIDQETKTKLMEIDQETKTKLMEIEQETKTKLMEIEQETKMEKAKMELMMQKAKYNLELSKMHKEQLEVNREINKIVSEQTQTSTTLMKMPDGVTIKQYLEDKCKDHHRKEQLLQRIAWLGKRSLRNGNLNILTKT
eukprot:jgi/Bigna1/129926/aug1.10_g4634